jgi:hypothetical protein
MPDWGGLLVFYVRHGFALKVYKAGAIVYRKEYESVHEDGITLALDVLSSWQ